MRTRMLPPMLALLLLPAAGAEPTLTLPDGPTETTLYFHLAGLQDFPINTQPPDDRYGAAESKGTLAHSTSCVPDAAGPLLASEHHTYYGFSTPGYVEYDVQEDGGPLIHPERGLSYDVRLDTQSPFTLHWYLETQVFPEGDVDPNTVPLAIPNVVVKATLRLGDDVSVGNEAFNAGDIVARGHAGPALLAPTTQDVEHSEVDGHHVYGFAVPMRFESDRIPRDASYNVRIDVYIENPVCDDPEPPEDAYLMPNGVKIHTSPGHRPRMVLSHYDALSIDVLHPQFVGDELIVHTCTNSPWGNYDVDESEGGLRLEIGGAMSARSLERILVPGPVHGHHDECLQAVWAWDYAADGAPDGVYHVRLAVQNDQATAEAVGEATFQIGRCADCAEEPGKAVPAPFGLVPLAVAGWLARRRGAS